MERASYLKEVPFSPQQRRLLDTAVPRDDVLLSALNVPLLVFVPGVRPRSDIVAAVRRLTQRFDALRLVIRRDGDTYRQYLCRFDDDTVERLVSFDEVPQGRMPQFLHDCLGTGVRLDGGPLLRAHVVTDGNTTAVLVIGSHLTLDGVSLQTMTACFQAWLDGKDEGPDVNGYSFVEYCESWRQGRDAEAESRRYWEGVFDRPYRPFCFTPRPAATAERRIPSERMRYTPPRDPCAVADLLDKWSVSPFALGAFAACVAASVPTGRRDLVVNYFSHGRTQPELRGAVGCYYAPIPLRFHADGERRLRDSLEQVANGVKRGIDHQMYDISRIIRELLANANHDGEDAFPLTTVAVNVQFDFIMRFQKGSHVPLGMHFVYDVMWNIGRDQDRRLYLTVDYRADKFEAAEIEQWSEVFWRTLERLRTVQDGAPLGVMLEPAAVRFEDRISE